MVRPHGTVPGVGGGAARAGASAPAAGRGHGRIIGGGHEPRAPGVAGAVPHAVVENDGRFDDAEIDDAQSEGTIDAEAENLSDDDAQSTSTTSPKSASSLKSGKGRGAGGGK